MILGSTAWGLVLLLTGCSSAGFYFQGVRGGLEILCKRQPVTEVIAGTDDPELAGRLRLVEEILAFAHGELGLPDNGSYRHYTALDRPYALWNVVAAPELSFEPLTWCFPFAGCVSYRGYFSRRRADDFAQGLREEGYDVAVSGVPAYSTLGWFRDPVLSTFVFYPDASLAGLVFHELTHQRIYLPGDTAFNEGLATAVEIEGVRRWLRETRGAEAVLEFQADRDRRAETLAFYHRARILLEEIYSGGGTVEEKRRRKAEILTGLQQDLGWEDGDHRLNNAHLAGLGSYVDLVPAFQALWTREEGDAEAFFTAVEELAALTAKERQERLAALPAEIHQPHD